MIVVGCISIKLGIDKGVENTYIYSYELKRNSDYEVELKPNKFYETENLSADYCYASQSINNIKVNFKHELNANYKANVNYKYNVTGELIGKVENNEKEVWNRHYQLLPDNCKNQEWTDKVCVNQEVNINYNEYSELVNCYEKEYGIKIDAILKIRLNIYLDINSVDCNLENKSIEDYIEIEIPITNTVTEIMKNYENTSCDKVNNSTTSVKEIAYYVAGVVLLLEATILVIRVTVKNKKSKIGNEKYEKKIKKILKYYKALIVTVKEEPDLNGLKIMSLNKLEDLIDLAEQNEKNIIYYKEKIKSKFYVIADGYVYIYEVYA